MNWFNRVFSQTLPCYLALFGLAEYVVWCSWFGDVDHVLQNFRTLYSLWCSSTTQHHPTNWASTSVSCPTCCLVVFSFSFSISRRSCRRCCFASLWNKNWISDARRLWWNIRLCGTSRCYLVSAAFSLMLYQNCGGAGTLWAKVKPLLIVAPCVLAVSWFFMLFFIRKLFEEFGLDNPLSTVSFFPIRLTLHTVGPFFTLLGQIRKWKVRIHVSSFCICWLHIEAMYRYYQIMLCFLKFDFFFVTGVTMQVWVFSPVSISSNLNALTATHSCDSNRLGWIRHYHCRYSNRSRSSSIMWSSRPARDQVVCDLISPSFSTVMLFSVMTISLVLMLSALTYCEWKINHDVAILTWLKSVSKHGCMVYSS